jgi:putative ABC transport system permease protein
MFRNYIKIAWRHLLKNKVFSFINVFGLAIGLSTCLLITLYIVDELGYDQYHRDADRIYRIASSTNKSPDWAATAAPIAWGIKADFPEVEQVTRLLSFPNMDNVLMRYGQNNVKKQFFEKNGYYVDSTFFQLFTYEFKYGDVNNALYRPNTIVLSESISEKLFGKQNPVDKVVKLGLPFGDFDYTVKGVFRENENKSHIPAHFFLSMRNGDVGTWVENQHNWANNNIFHTYVKLKNRKDAKAFGKKLPAFINRRGEADLKDAGFSKSLFIQPMEDIYLHSNLDGEIAPNGNIKYLYILGTIALFILAIACINFMNLSTARSQKRAREVGVRKVMGAGKWSLVWQFLGESVLMSVLALLLALVLAWIFLPLFNSLTEKNLQLFGEAEFIFFMIALTLGTGLVSGLYPAFYLSSFKPVSVIKGKIINSFSASIIRKGLVVFQFTISVCLIMGAIVIFRQLHYVENEPLGFNKNQQIVLPLQSSEAAKNYSVLKNELLKNPDVKQVTSCSAYPGIQNINDMLFYSEGKTVSDNVDIHMATVENDFFETLGFRMLHGRGFSKDFTSDSTSIVLNEKAVRDLGYQSETAVGKNIYFDFEKKRQTYRIIGVVKDFHFESLHNEIKPFGFSGNYFFANKYNYLIANVRSADYSKVVAGIQKSWNKLNRATPFAYSFIDEDFQKNYEKEKRTSGIVISFTSIAISIACLGLFGLAAFSAEQRTKEIGIRKVLGAAGSSIVTMLSKDFLKLIPLALLIAFPLGWWAMNKWLDNFVYRIQISWWMFGLAGGIAILIAFLTVSYQSIKSALANPLKSLRTE